MDLWNENKKLQNRAKLEMGRKQVDQNEEKTWKARGTDAQTHAQKNIANARSKEVKHWI